MGKISNGELGAAAPPRLAHCLALTLFSRLVGPHKFDVCWMRHTDQLAGQVRPVNGVQEEEPQRRHNAVHGRRRHARITLFDLEPANVIRRRRIR
jgi:hypothetical protein